MKKIVRKIKSIFVQKPDFPISWNSEDYIKAERWAKTQNHPFNNNLTLWDYVYDKYDSVYTLQNLNNYMQKK